MSDIDLEFKLPEGIKDPGAEFDLHESLGKGSFGAVYRATYKKTLTVVAIKEVIVNEDFMEILKEINIMKQCKSRYVVQYFGNYFKGDNCWIVMEYCAFGSVGDLLNLTQHALSEPQIAHICRSTLKGLSYLHRSNKIHRDIKPGNILVTGKGECKLADFGVSGTLSERTRKRNTVIGTPFFLAPEVIQEVGYDSKADIWALGITAIELAEQNPPYYDVHPMRVLFLIPTNPSPTLKSPQSWSPEFSDFLKCCLDKDPSRRSSAKQLLKHPFIAKGKSSAVMRAAIDEAQVVIDAAGGRLQALKEISNKKAEAHSKGGKEDTSSESDESNDSGPESDSESESESSDEEPQRIVKTDSMNRPTSTPTTPTSSGAPTTPTSSNQASILELDSILSGIRTKSSTGSPKSSPSNSFLNTTPSSTPPKPKATPEEELDALLSGLQAKAKVSAQSKPPASPSSSRKPAAAAAPASPLSRAPAASSAVSSPPVQKFSRKADAERSLAVSGNWDQFNCGGCSNSPDWRKNPQYLFRVTSPAITSAQITLMQNFGVKQELVPIGFYVVKAGKGNLQGRKVLSLGKDYTVEYISEQTNFQLAKSVTARVKVEIGEYVVIPATFTPGLEASFELEVLGNPTQPSSERLELSPLPIPPSTTWSEARINSEWKASSAGGSYSTSSSTWRDNPKVVITTDKQNTVTIILSRSDSSTSTFCGFYLFKSPEGLTPTASLMPVNLVSKTTFVNGSEVVLSTDLPSGKYVVLPCTYDANQESPFTLSVYSKHPVKLSHQDENCIVIRGGWNVASGTAGGCVNHPSWRANPQYLVTCKGPTRAHVVLEQAGQDTTKLPFIGLYVLKHQIANSPKPIFLLNPKDVVGNTEFMNLQVVLTIDLEGSNIILPSTFVPFADGLFTLRISFPSSVAVPTVVPVPAWPVAKSGGTWKGITAGGRYTSASTSWKNNPRFLVTPKVPSHEPIQFAVVLVQSEKPSPLGIGFYIFKKVPDGSLTAVLGKSGFVSGREVAMEAVLQPGDEAIILPSTFEADQEDTFLLSLYSSKECTLNPV